MIRILGPADSAAMATLHKKSILPYWSAKDMAGHCQRDLCLGYSDPLRGFVIVQCAADQAEILTIVTDPDHRKSGIAGSVLSAAEDNLSARGVTIIFLEVAEDNNPAIAFYRSAGFEPFGKRPAYYRRETGRVAALTFRKRLDA